MTRKETRSPHRTVVNVLFSALTLLGLHAHGQFNYTSTDIPWSEADGIEGADGGASLANLNSKLAIALSDPADTTLCYLLSGTPTNALTFNTAAASCSVNGKSGKRSLASNWLRLMSNQHVDYELGETQLLTITGYDAEGEEQATFAVNLAITDADERPVLIQPSREKSTRYWVPGDSVKLLIFDLFRDPDGANVYFDSRAVATDVWVCDTANAGDFAINEVAVTAARELGLGTPVTFTGGDATANCSVSNEADPSAIPAPDPSPGMRGTAGNRVVTTKRLGPYLEITADSLADDTDGNGTITDRGAGTYAARIYIRAWSGPNETPLSAMEFAVVNIQVKVGANNPPQFAGGAAGFAVSLTEGDDISEPMPAWAAGDLDIGGSTNDSLVYGLNGTRSKNVSIAGGTLTLRETTGDNPATSATETDFVVSLALAGKKLDFERAPSPFTVDLVVTDQWSEPVIVPIEVTLIDVNELTTTKEGIEDQQLSNGLSREFNLGEYFEDPEGDEVTYEAYTNLYDDVVEVDNNTDTLTIHGRHATEGQGGESTVTVTVIATDSKGLVADLEFDLVTRYENQPPSINVLENGTISLGTNIFEADSAGTVLMPLIEYTDDYPAPTAIFNHEPQFKAIVNPYLIEEALDSNQLVICSKGTSGCVEQMGKVAIVVGAQDLNFESNQLHKLSLALQDAWNPELVSAPIEFQVAVHDSNDPPTIVVRSIETQTIAVHGSGSYRAGPHFTDEDSKDKGRIRVYAKSSDETVVKVDVTELDLVHFEGLREGVANVTLTAIDTEGASVDLSFQVRVQPNNAPRVNQEAVDSQLPANHVVDESEFVEVELAGLFEEPDNGDKITSIVASTSDERILLAIPTHHGEILTLVGREAGTVTLTITATDEAENTTSIEREITVNATPDEAMPLDPQTLDRVTPYVVDVSGVFTDSDDGDDSLTITAEAVGEGMDRVRLAVDGFELTITGVMNIEPGDVEIELIATDPHGSSVKSSFMATTVNIAPTVAASIDAQELDRIDPLGVDVSKVFADVDGEIIMITASVPEDAVIEVGEIDPEDRLLMVTALSVGEATVKLEATDNNGGLVAATLMITVNNVDPVVTNPIMDHTSTRIMDLVIDISETFNDPDTDSVLTFTASAADDMIASASVEDSTLMVEGLYVGSTTITVTAIDVDGGTFSHDFMVEIENVKPTLALSIDDMEFNRIAPLGIDLSDAFADVDGMISTLTAMVGDGSLVEATIEDSTLTLTALAVGSTTIDLTAVDDNGGEIMTSFMISVVNLDPVVANAVADQTTTRVDDLMLDMSMTFDDPDQENSLLSITVSVEDDMTVATMLDGHVLTISGLEVGSTNITLTAVDADGGTVSDTFMATIENVDPVVANSIADQEMDRRAPLVLDLSDTFSDADDGAPTITVMIGSGAVLSAVDVTDMTLALNALAVGETVVTLTATDVNGASVMDEFNVTVINIEPVVANAIADQTTTRVNDVSINVGATFDDPDQDNSMLSISVTVDNGMMVEAVLEDHVLVIKGLDVGSANITLTARDADGGMVRHSFTTTIENVAPVVASSISPINLEVGGQAASQAIAGLFNDDGDPLSYSISSVNSGIANTSISGTTAMIGPVSRGATNFTITATDPHGGSASVSGSVTVGDGELKVVAAKSLAGFGRALLASVSSSVGQRILIESNSSDSTLDTWAPINDLDAMSPASVELGHDIGRHIANTTIHDTQSNLDTTSGVEALRSLFGNAFALNLGTRENRSRWAVWGSTDIQSYDGDGYDGMASSVYLGADATVSDSWTLGVAVARNSGESDYSWGTATQSMDIDLDSILPYVRYRPTSRTSLWGIAGIGSGELETTVVGAANDVSSLRSQLALLGSSQVLTRNERFKLALRSDVAIGSLETDEGDGAADELIADVSRIRLGLESSFQKDTGDDGMLEPFGQVHLRSDAGDEENSTGVELVGGVRMTSSKFVLEVHGRTLVLHGVDEYSESGFSVVAKLNPSANGTGFSVSVAPRWGSDAHANNILWQDALDLSSFKSYGPLAGIATTPLQKSIDAQIAYGLLVASEHYLLTPFVNVGVSEMYSRELLFGVYLRPSIHRARNFNLNLAFAHIDDRNGASIGKIGLNTTITF